MSTTRNIGRIGLAAGMLAVVPSLVAQAGNDHGRGRDPELVGRAVLPVDTYAPGPPITNAFPPGVVNGVTFPLPSQPVEGFSGIVEGRRPGEYLAMADNGFGGKANSSQFLIRAYYLTPDFKTRHGGTGDIAVGEFVSFSDPDGVIGFPIVNEGTTERLLTGADIDPESIARGHHGDLWLGDEFGPWILHFDGEGRLLEPPIGIPDSPPAATPVLTSPNTPGLVPGTNTMPNSRGIEALAVSPNGHWLTFVLEGSKLSEDSTTRRVYQYNVRNGTFTRLADYRVENGLNMVADADMIDNHRLVLIERDGGLGATALFRRVYVVDLHATGPDGAVVKRQLVDLAAIPDPHLVSLPAIHAGDIGLGDPFQVTCESIEAIHVVSHDRLLLGCDNNFPNKGRNPGRADDNELIVVKVPGL